MKTFLLRLWRWQARRNVKAMLNKTDVEVYIVCRKHYVNEYGKRVFKEMYWNDKDFTDMIVYAAKYKNSIDLKNALVKARRKYIFENKIREARLTEFDKQIQKL